MRVLRDAATGREKEVLTRAVTTIEKMKADRDLNGHFLELVELVRDLGALDPKSIDLQVSVTGSFLSFPMMAPTFRQDPAPLRKEALTRARALVSAFPKEGRAHSVNHRPPRGCMGRSSILARSASAS